MVNRRRELPDAWGENEPPRTGAEGAGTEVARASRFDLVQWREEQDRAEEIRARCRARVSPVRFTAATAGAGYVGWGAGWLAELVAGPVGHIAATGGTALLSAGAAATVSLLGRRRVAQWRRSYDAAMAGGAGWVMVTAAVGPGWGMAAALLAGAAGAATSWRRSHATPLALDAAPAPWIRLPQPQTVVAQDEGDRIAARWLTEVTGPGGVIPKAAPLSDRVDLDRGYRWVVQLGRGDYYSRVAGLTEAIAAALHLPTTAVLLEPYTGDASRALLTVITRDALTDGVPYSGPLYHDGRIPLGLYADGEGIADVTVRDSGGVYPVALTGDPRSGKSTAFEATAQALRASGEWMVLFADGDVGAGSSSIMAEVAHWPDSGPRMALRQLECLESVLAARQAIKATLTVHPDTGLLVPIVDPSRQRPAAKMLPCPEYPGWMLMLDEAFRFVQDPWLQEQGYVQRLEAWIRTGPKYGMTVVYSTHSRLKLDYWTSVLRGLVHARNSLAFRAESSSEATSINGVLVYPSALPHGGGYAFAAHSTRVAMLRTGYPVMLPREPWPHVTPDPDSWLGAQPHWPEGERDPSSAYRAAQKRRDEWRRQAEVKARGERATGVVDQPPTTPAVASGYPQLAGLAEQAVGLVHAAKVLPFRRSDQSGADARTAVDQRLNDADRRVLAAVRSGCRRSYLIVEHTGLKGPDVSKAGKRLAAWGYLIDGGYGSWDIPSAHGDNEATS